MTTSNYDPERPQARDTIKMPGDVKDHIFDKDEMMASWLKDGYSPEEAEENYRQVRAVLDDPEAYARFLHLQELRKQYGDQAMSQAVRAEIAYRKERDRTKPTLKVWTEDEEDRRTTPGDGKGTPTRT